MSAFSCLSPYRFSQLQTSQHPSCTLRLAPIIAEPNTHCLVGFLDGPKLQSVASEASLQKFMGTGEEGRPGRPPRPPDDSASSTKPSSLRGAGKANKQRARFSDGTCSMQLDHSQTDCQDRMSGTVPACRQRVAGSLALPLWPTATAVLSALLLLPIPTASLAVRVAYATLTSRIARINDLGFGVTLATEHEGAGPSAGREPEEVSGVEDPL